MPMRMSVGVALVVERVRLLVGAYSNNTYFCSLSDASLLLALHYVGDNALLI